MNKRKIIKEVKNHVKELFKNEPTGHDWWHIFRTWKMSKIIREKEGGDLFVIELAALLHDIADWKFNEEEGAGSKEARILLNKLNVEKEVIDQVCHIVDNVSFKGAMVANGIKTKEGKIVQDADRLDVIGAIGIARVFSYYGFKGVGIYNPSIKPKEHKSFYEYKNRKTTAINHFYEKVILLKNRLNTKTAKEIAHKRHLFLEKYLDQFFEEWNFNL